MDIGQLIEEKKKKKTQNYWIKKKKKKMMMKKKTENEQKELDDDEIQNKGNKQITQVLAMKQTSYGFHETKYFWIPQDRAISSQTSSQLIKCNFATVISIHRLKNFSQTGKLLLRKAFSYYLIAQNRDKKVLSIWMLDLVFKRSTEKLNIKHEYALQINS